MLVPVEFSLHDAEANNAIIDLAQGLVKPLLTASFLNLLDVDQLQRLEADIGVDLVGGFRGHRCFSFQDVTRRTRRSVPDWQRSPARSGRRHYTSTESVRSEFGGAIVLLLLQCFKDGGSRLFR